MKTKAIIIFLLISIVFTSLVVYGQKEEKMDMYGEITKVVFNEEGKLEEIVIENIDEDQDSYDKAVAIITEKTKILKGDLEINELKEGQVVGIIFKEGPITMIYPARVEAELIKVKGESESAKPIIEVPVNLEVEENEQKSVDNGHSPWRLDPVYVAQVYLSLKISPEGITGEYPVPYEDLKVIKKTEQDAVVAVGGDKSPIKKVYLKRLIRQDSTGIWTVVGYDPVKDIEKMIMDEFDVLIKKDNEVSDVLNFINKNISIISRENASRMINEFERIQKKNLSKIEEKYFSEDIQNRVYKIYQPGFDLNEINDRNKIAMMDDQQLKELLLATRNSGYKVETAEGMFFPVIDYEYYQRYSSNVTHDMREYIKIMSIESNRVPAKDAALVISWDEIIKRALSQEKFIIQYPESMKIKDVRELYKKYLTFTLFGLNNTPLFSYNSKVMVADAKNAYQKAVDSNENSIFIKTLQEFLELLKINNYRLTEEIDKYRKSTVENILSAYDSNKTTQKEIIAAMQSDIDILKEESSVQQIQESNYGDSTQVTQVLKITDSEIQFDAVNVKNYLAIDNINNWPVIMDLN